MAALFVIAKTQKQPTYPWTDEERKEMRYIYTTEYYSDIKKNGMPPAATWMGLETIIPSKVSQRGKHKHHMTSFIYGAEI